MTNATRNGLEKALPGAPAAKRGGRVRWFKLAAILLALIGLTFGLAYLFQTIWSSFQLPTDNIAWLAYLTVFLVTLVTNLTIIAPVPIATAVMIAMASQWNPLLIALVASIGGTVGELSGYYAGYLGKKIAIAEDIAGYTRVASWMRRYGPWAVLFLAIQPAIPFDIAGLVAGATKMPLKKFIPSLWAGKFIKYALLCYFGIQFLRFVPSWAK